MENILLPKQDMWSSSARPHLAAKVEGFGVRSSAEEILHYRFVSLRSCSLHMVVSTLVSRACENRFMGAKSDSRLLEMERGKHM